MKSAVETLNPTRVKLTVEVPYEELKPSLDAALKDLSRQIHMPGFRPGKVPARLIEQRIGKGAIIAEAVQGALPDFYGQAVESEKLRPLGPPEVDIVDMPEEDGEQLTFTAELDVRPEITLPPFEELVVEVDVLDDDAVAGEAESRMGLLRQRFGALNDVDREAQNGDFVTIDLSAQIGGEEIDSVKGVSYEIGSGNMLAGMDENLTGMKVEETTTFSAPLAGGDRAGEDAEITVTMHAVKERQLPELDDDFAQEASEFDTFAELEEDIARQARQAKLFEQGVQARDRLLDLLLETVDFEVPQSLVDAEVHNHLESEDRLDDDEHRAEVSENARKSLRAQLLLDQIVEEDEIEVEQAELIEYLVLSAQQMGMDPGQLAQAMDAQQQVPAMVSEVARRKALAGILEKIQVKDSDGTVIDLNEVIETDAIDAEEDAIDDIVASGDDVDEDLSDDAAREAVEEAVDAEQDDSSDEATRDAAEEAIDAEQEAEEEAADDEGEDKGAADAT